MIMCERGTLAKIVTRNERIFAKKSITIAKHIAKVGSRGFNRILNVPRVMIIVAGTDAGTVHIAVKS